MRPKIAIWSDYGVPTQKHWRSPYRRRSSTGRKVLLLAVVFVGSVIGISGIYPQIIDSEWVQSASTHAKRAVADALTTRRSTIVAAIPLSQHRTVTTTGEAGASETRSAASASAPQRSVAAVALSPNETKPPLHDVPDAQVMADPLAQPAPAAGSEVRPAKRYFARAPMVKKHVLRTVHHRGYSGAYARYGGWGARAGWEQGMGSSYRL